MQCVHAAAPALDDDPAGQGRHESAELAPVSPEYVPAAQLTQDGDPPVLNEEKVPAGQIVQAFEAVDPDAALKYPDGHFEQIAAPAIECVPGAHVVQVAEAVAPRTAEYVPAAQSVHTARPAASAYDPAGHGMHTVEPATE